MSPILAALVLIAGAAVLAWLTIWSRRDTWARPAAVVLFLCAIPIIGGALAETLGRHKPLAWAWGMTAEEYHVLAAVMVQDEAIWLYIIDPERLEPRPVVLPWSNEMAQAVQDAMDGAPDGKEGQFKLRIDGTPGGEMTAHALPQPAQPPAKDTPDPGMTYEPAD